MRRGAKVWSRLLASLIICAVADAADTGRTAFVSVLIQLSYGERCRSAVTLENLRERTADVDVEGHDGSGALVKLEGASSKRLHLAPAQKTTLRLQDEGQESAEAWIKVTETEANGGPGVAVSGSTECTMQNEVTTVPGAVAFPSRDPWLEADVDDLQGKTVLVLNSDAAAAAVRVCYSNGSQVELPRRGTGGEITPVCRSTRSVHLPPFALELLPVEREGSSNLTVRTRGAALVLKVLKPQPGKTRVFSVDSSIVFEDMAKP